MLYTAVLVPLGAPAMNFSGVGTLPDFLILGAQKAGTTSVFELLRDAGLICGRCCLPNYDLHEKEAHFWDRWGTEWDQSTLAEYTSYYQPSPSCDKFVDATPNYLFTTEIAGRMAAMMPAPWIQSVRLLVIAREPISRDLSIYNMIKALWWQDGKSSDETAAGEIDTQLCKYDGSFPTYKQAVGCKIVEWHQCLTQAKGDHDAAIGLQLDVAPWSYCNLNRLTNGMYHSQVKAYSAVFPRSHMMVINFESMVSSQREYIGYILGHFRLPQSPLLTTIPADNNLPFPGKVHKIDCHTRAQLEAIYDPHNADLYAYLAGSPRARPAHEPAFAPFTPPSCVPAGMMEEEASYVDYRMFAKEARRSELAREAAYLAKAHAAKGRESAQKHDQHGSAQQGAQGQHAIKP